MGAAVNHLRTGNEQCGYEEGGLGKFDDPHFAAGSETTEDHARICETYLVGRVQPDERMHTTQAGRDDRDFETS